MNMKAMLMENRDEIHSSKQMGSDPGFLLQPICDEATHTHKVKLPKSARIKRVHT